MTWEFLSQDKGGVEGRDNWTPLPLPETKRSQRNHKAIKLAHVADNSDFEFEGYRVHSVKRELSEINHSQVLQRSTRNPLTDPHAHASDKGAGAVMEHVAAFTERHYTDFDIIIEDVQHHLAVYLNVYYYIS